jgi:hypothetical protein
MFKQGLHRWWQRSDGLFGSHSWFAEIGAHAVLQHTGGVNAWRRHKHRNQNHFGHDKKSLAGSWFWIAQPSKEDQHAHVVS